MNEEVKKPRRERLTHPDRVAAPSVVVVNTGHGKGKTTAAMGTLIRAVARGWKVCVIQFIKSGQWRAGEEQVARELGVDWWTLGDGFTWDSEDLDRSEAISRSAWEAAKDKISSGGHDVVVLDEITYPMNWGWISTEEVAAAIRTRPRHVNVIATGRDAPPELVDVADTVTEMVNVRHAYDRGVRARRGIDY
jgi:cob(I)alamin adenosyltransferase